MLDSFDRVAEGELAGDDKAFDDEPRITRWNDAMRDFIANAIRLDLSFNDIIGGFGEPFMDWERATNA